MISEEKKEVDIFRDTLLRYLGYANEVGEAFRALVHVNVVRFSYVVASGYVVADSIDKGIKAKNSSIDVDTSKIALVSIDALIWQAFASVIVPGFTINRICKANMWALNKTSKLPINTKKWLTTALGLGCIPLIIKPIDNGVHLVMNSTFRKHFDLPEGQAH